MATDEVISVSYKKLIEKDGFWVYQVLMLVRSLVVLLGVYGFDMMFKKTPFILPIIFPSLKINTPKVRAGGTLEDQTPLNVFNIQVNQKISNDIIESYLWIIRTAVTVVILYLFDTIAVNNHFRDLGNDRDWNNIIIDCIQGWNCYRVHENSSSFGALLFVSRNMLPVCDEILNGGLNKGMTDSDRLLAALLRRNGSYSSGLEQVLDANAGFWATKARRERQASCFRKGDTSFTAVMANLSIAGAGFTLMVLFFESMVAVMIRHRRKRFGIQRLIDVIIILLCVGWVVLVAWEAVVSNVTWVSRLAFLALPIVLYQARTVASKIRLSMEMKNRKRGLANVYDSPLLVGLGQSPR